MQNPLAIDATGGIFIRVDDFGASDPNVNTRQNIASSRIRSSCMR